MDRRTALKAGLLITPTIATGLGSGLLPAAALAQAYPRPGAPIRYVVPFPPGGLTDMMARLVAQQLGDRWGVSVVVENKPGSGGQIGAAEVARAAGDGQTLLAVTMSHAVNATLYRGKAPFDFEKDLRPVALLAGSPMLVVVPAASPIRTLPELADAAKTRRLNAGSSGNGTPPHLTLALFNQLQGTTIQHVPYKGGAPSMADLIGGQIDVIFSNFPESQAHVTGGRLRALALASAARHPLFPDVPTTAEAGLPGLAVENWTAMMAPAATPDPVVAKLGDEVVRILAAPEIADRARTQGFRVDARGPAAFAPFLTSEIGRWAKLIAAARIAVD